MTLPTTRPYPLDNMSAHGGAHLDGLAASLDPFTLARLADVVGDLTGKLCLEVGAGCGSVALWMAQRVGPGGRVVAVDLKPDRIPAHPQLTVREVDLLTHPLPVDGVHVAHERLTLNHLPPRDRILRAMFNSLLPGGVLLVEEWDSAGSVGGVLHAPSVTDARLYTRYMRRRGEIFAAAGTERGWARHLHEQLIGYGAQDVRTVVHSRSWRGGEPASRHALATLRQFHDRLLAAGMRDYHLARIEELLNDPDFHVCAHALYSVSAHKPAGLAVAPGP